LRLGCFGSADDFPLPGAPVSWFGFPPLSPTSFTCVKISPYVWLMPPNVGAIG